ncbi:hypothetical protein ACIBF1_41255 [Spirillospora sp. NPDC050679]
MDRSGWYGVRCVIFWPQGDERLYEESITVWRASSFDEAIAKAETEALDYATVCDGQYLGLAQAYFIGDGASITEGTEVFSLMRASDLDQDEYVTRYFATGRERQRSLGEEE